MRMHQEYKADITLVDYTHLDALLLNIERACQAAIDLAMHIVAVEHLGVPQSSADSFKLLRQADKLDDDLVLRLIGMTGFRNIVIHQYQDLELDLIHHIMKEGIKDLVLFCKALGMKINS